MISRDEFDRTRFTDVDIELQRRLWAFLTQDAIVRKMIQASDRGKSAPLAIQSELHVAFGQDIRADRVHMNIGNLVKQVMERRGYVRTNAKERTKSGPLFSSGEIYTRRP